MVVLALGLAFMIVFTFFAVRLVLWQGNDISVSIVSESDKGHSEVTISVLNTAGSTLLFYENPQICGKLEYLGESGWMEYSDISYSYGNVNAISQKYGGTFAELAPGEGWTVSVPEEILSNMVDGTYRIKMTYIIEDDFNEYLESKFIDKDKDITEEKDNGFVNNFLPISRPLDNEEIKEAFIGESISEIYTETFEYKAPEDFLDSISFDDSIIEE